MPPKAGSEQRYTNKTTHSLASPFPDPAWPLVGLSDQETVRDLLCELLAPIGKYRRDHVEPSRGKRTRKRKRVEDKTANGADNTQDSMTISKLEPPPVPEILHGLTVGYNSTHRALEGLIRARRIGPHLRNSDRPQDKGDNEDETPQQLAAIFVDRASQPKIIHSHLPLLLAAVSPTSQDSSTISLVTLPNGSEEKLSTALQIPRVSMIGVFRDAQGAKPVLDLIAEKVPPLDASWLQVQGEGKYQPLKLDTKTAKVPVLPAKSVRREQARIEDEKRVLEPR